MQKAVGEPQSVRVLGKMACFTRPECRAERFSSVAGSVSAWDGLLSQVQGHRGVRYEIDSVAMLFYPRWLVQTANEVRDFGTGTRGPVSTEVQRTLRTTAYLAGQPRTIDAPTFDGKREKKEFAGVDYLVTFRLTTTDPREYDKQADMLRRRLSNGHFWRQPYLGIRELTADVEPVGSLKDFPYPDITLYTHENGLKAADYNADLGLSFFGIDWEDPTHPHYFYPMKVEHGVLRYPTWKEVYDLGISRKGTRC